MLEHCQLSFLIQASSFKACTRRDDEVVEAAEALDAALSATSSSPLKPPGAGGGSGAALMTSEQLQAQARPLIWQACIRLWLALASPSSASCEMRLREDLHSDCCLCLQTYMQHGIDCPASMIRNIHSDG